MTYARARLFVGTAGVGLWVLIAVAFLAAGGPDSLPDADSGFGAQVALVAVVIAVYAIVSLPFDLFGGLILPRRHGRTHPRTADYVLAWIRGVLVQGSTMALCVGAVVWAGRGIGVGGAIAAVALLSIAIGTFRLPLARLVADLGTVAPAAGQPHIAFLGAHDPGFTGGVTGIGGSVVMPAAWQQVLGDDLAVEVARRRSVQRGPYLFGLLAAVAWTTAGAAIAIALPGAGVQSAGQVISAGAWFTLWSFVGLLVLPTLSRPAVLAADASANATFGQERVARVINILDALQDDEPERADAIEAIFHPIPSAARRVEHLGHPAPSLRVWHIARMALPMSWVFMGLLGRAVHCNAGRPELWVMLPSD